MIGKTLGHYRILEKIGAGSMGEVYLAEDTRLGRKVAVKALPSEFAADSERLVRFEREARAAAALNHPHIAAVYDVGCIDETHFIVQEHMEGQTLGALLAGGGLPLNRILELSMEIAEALAAAHAAAIVHRDLKPENIFVLKDGHAKILDFGLAKHLERPQSLSAADSTLSQLPTTAGQLLGTPGYMAPEQVQGQSVDHRADVFAFGCILYAMTTGKSPFEASSAIESLHQILHDEPTTIQYLHLPAELERIIEKCLAKDPVERYQHAADLVVDLRRLRRDATARPATGVGAPRQAVAHAMRFSITLPPTAPLALGEHPALVLSPDGTRLVYVGKHRGGTQLYLRALDHLEPTPLAGTEDASGPFFSPDGKWVGFFAQGKLKKLSLMGGGPLTLCDAPESRGASWAGDDTIVFAPVQSGGLWQVSSSALTPQVVTKPELKRGDVTHRWPELLPAGKAVLFTIGIARSTSYDDARVALHLLHTHEERILIEGGSNPRYIPTGHLVFTRAGTLFAVAFDLARLEVVGSVVPILAGVATETTGVAHWTFSRCGTLVYAPGGPRTAGRTLVWVNRKGLGRPLPAVPRTFEEPRLSPDARLLALGIREVTSDVWVYEMRRGTLSRLTFEADNFSPIWTPDGKRVTFSSNRAGPSNLFWTPADGSGTVERLLASDYDQVASSWSPDGRLLAFTEYHPDTGADIWILSLKGERKPRPFLRTPFNEWGAMFSPDGRWLAYTSDESGRPEVYVQPFPSSGAKWQISNEGGTEPVWARNGAELFYRNHDKIMAVRVKTEPQFAAAKARVLFQGSYLGSSVAYLPNYDLAPNGQRFLMLKQSEDVAEKTELYVVLNWFADLTGRIA